MAFIEIKNLKYRYPHTERLALDGIHFEVERGSFTGIVGANKAGKSTLCQALVGLVPNFYKGAYGGCVTVDGLEAAKTPVAELCRKVGLVFQNPFNQLSGAKDTVFGEVAFGLQNLGVPREELVRRVEESMRLMEIDAYRDRNPFDLSGGQVQRVAIASILAMQPEVIVLDEPTSQLDPQGSEEVFRVVEKLADRGITIFMAEHKPEKLAAYCSRILLLDGGRQLAFGRTEEVFSRDDLAELGIAPPVYTQVCRALGVRRGDTYPVTLAQTEALRAQFPQEMECADWEVRKKIEKAVCLTSSLEHMDGIAGTATEGGLENESVLAENILMRGCQDGAGDRASESIWGQVRGNAPGTEVQGRPENGASETGAQEHAENGTSEMRVRQQIEERVAVRESTVFQIENLCFSYAAGSRVFDGLNLVLDARPTAIIGQNGAGKTTLVKMLKGLLKPESGRVLFRGEDTAQRTVAQLAGHIGYVFQNPDDQIFKNRVLDEVMVGPLNIGVGAEQARELAKRALTQVGLWERAQENPYDLDLAERKLVAIASVLAMDPEVLILDEPTIAQDAAGKRRIGELARALSAQGKTVIAVLHDMDFVAEYFSRVIAMAHGRVLADGSGEEVFYRPEVLREARLEQPHTAKVSARIGYKGRYLTPEALQAGVCPLETKI